MGFSDSSVGEESACHAGDTSSIPGSGRSARKGIGYPLQYSWASLVAQLVKNSPAMRRPGFNPWVEKMPWRRERLPTPVFWRIPWTEDPGRVQSMRLQRVRHNWEICTHTTSTSIHEIMKEVKGKDEHTWPVKICIILCIRLNIKNILYGWDSERIWVIMSPNSSFSICNSSLPL